MTQRPGRSPPKVGSDELMRGAARKVADEADTQGPHIQLYHR